METIGYGSPAPNQHVYNPSKVPGAVQLCMCVCVYHGLSPSSQQSLTQLASNVLKIYVTMSALTLLI